jgi:hypothetical protein
MYHTIIFGTLLCAPLILLLSPTDRDYLGTCEHLVKLLQKLPFRNQYEHLSGFADFVQQDYAKMWEESGGLLGIIARLYISMICVRLIQIHYRDGRLSRDDARYIWNKIALQALFSLLSLPESLLCRIWSEMPRLSTAASIGYYCEIVLRTNTLCVSPGSPACILQLNELL